MPMGKCTMRRCVAINDRMVKLNQQKSFFESSDAKNLKRRLQTSIEICGTQGTSESAIYQRPCVNARCAACEPLCVVFRGRIGKTPAEAVFEQNKPVFQGNHRGLKTSRRKERRHCWRRSDHKCPQCGHFQGVS